MIVAPLSGVDCSFDDASHLLHGAMRVSQRVNMASAARIRTRGRLQKTAIENGVVDDSEHDLLQQIVDGSKSVIRPLAVRIALAGTTTFGGS